MKTGSTLVLGIMSGTSMDSADYALCEIRRGALRLQDYWQVKYPRHLQARLHAAAKGEASSHETAQLHHDLGRFYALHAGTKGKAANLIGLHGQTIFHHPDQQQPATLQIGEPAYLAEALRVPVISNFRAADLAVGGEGAPLATLFHLQAFAARGRHVCVNNLGGISNVTSIDWRKGRAPRVLAFDTGPANVLLDVAMRHYTRGRQSMDRGGRWARRGTANEALLRRWLKHEFFLRPPPKSTGRELFGEPFFRPALAAFQKAGLTPCDALATFAELTARSLALNYRLHLPTAPDQVVLTGGGAANRFLVSRIRAALEQHWPMVELRTGKDWGWPEQSLEPAAFAWLAWRRWHRQPGNLPATTGARRAVLSGQITEL